MLTHTCVKCSKQFTEYGLRSHMWRAHTTKGKKHKPTSGRVPWNKGLTVSDERVAAYTKKSAQSKIGKPGNPHTLKTKRALSKARKAFLKAHPEKHPWNICRKRGGSYPEKILAQQLRNLKVRGWKREFFNTYYWYDFGFPSVKLDVEIDGSTHLQNERIEKDDVRDKFSIREGWTVVRFTAATVNHSPKACAQEIAEIVRWLKKKKPAPFLTKITLPC